MSNGDLVRTTSAPEFLDNLDNYRLMLAAGNLTTAPDMQFSYADEHGITALTVSGMQLGKGPHTVGRTVFDLLYAHQPAGDSGPMPEPISLAGLARTRTEFTLAEENEADTCLDLPEYALVYVPARSLTARKGLVPLAHELGHSGGREIFDIGLNVVSGRQLSAEQQLRIKPFGPVVQALGKLASQMPFTATEVNRVLDEGFDDLETTRLWDRLSIGIVAKARLMTALRALREVDAWLGALNMIEGGYLHPGMEARKLYRSALKDIATYDADSNTKKLFSKTLLYAMHATGRIHRPWFGMLWPRKR